MEMNHTPFPIKNHCTAPLKVWTGSYASRVQETTEFIQDPTPLKTTKDLPSEEWASAPGFSLRMLRPSGSHQ
jgi:hypothetical protein